MSEIRLRAEDARGHAADMKGRAADSRDEFEQLRSRLMGLSESFAGKTKEKFDERFEEWRTSANGLVDALDGLGTFLDAAANQIEGLDDELASRLNG